MVALSPVLLAVGGGTPFLALDLTQAEGTWGCWPALPHSLPTMPCPGCRERMDLKAPIYFSTGLTEKANHYYKLFIPWTNQKIRKTFVQRNMFEFKHIKAFDRAFADSPGPMVCPGAAGGGGGREFHLARARLHGAACLCARKVGGQKALRVGGHLLP